MSQPRILQGIIPVDAQPGVTQMAFDVDDSEELYVTVPDGAQPGDQLRLTENNDSWDVFIVKRIRKDESKPSTRMKIKCLVPPEIAPGETMSIETGDGRKVMVKVPKNAKPADTLVLEEDQQCAWKCTLLKRNPKERDVQMLHDFANLKPPRAAPMDDNIAFERLSLAVKDAGGNVSSKIHRGAVAPLFILGMVAAEHIEAGEELCRIPQKLHITVSMIEKVSPRLAAAMLQCKEIPPQRFRDTLLTTFVAQVLHGADGRAVIERNNQGTSEDAFLPELDNHVDPGTKQAWIAFGDSLLSQDFAYHPYRKAASNPDDIRKSMLPSPEVDAFIDGAGDCIAMHELITTHLPEMLLGSHFEEVSMFLRAKLCTLTRAFHTEESALVPLADFFNHQSGSSGASWLWKPDEDAMVVVANRAFSPGEEIFISYGARSNVLLCRTYGFTQAPSVEPSWSFGLRHDFVGSIFDVFLPVESRHLQITLDALDIEDNLVDALNAASQNGQNAAEMLRLICMTSKAPYEKDVRLRPAWEALQQARSVNPTHHNWWEYIDSTNSYLVEDDGIRVKMSEMLCLTAHLEALEVYYGKREESTCFARCSDLTRHLNDAFRVLSENGIVKLAAVDDSA